ncbi:hypothetical protein V6N13_051397 [Hibiscus sabdariffa]
MWCTLGCSYALTHGLESLDPPLGCRHRIGEVDCIRGCSMALIRDQGCMVTISKEGKCMYLPYIILGPMVEILLSPKADKRVKDWHGSRGCSLVLTRNRTCGSDCHYLRETVLLDWGRTVFSRKTKDCWELIANMVLSLVGIRGCSMAPI